MGPRLAFFAGLVAGAMLEDYLRRVEQRANPATRVVHGFTQADIDRAHERGEQFGQRLGRLNEQMGA